MIRKQFIATGKVQGVGFRFFVKLTATPLNITGKTENLNDGSVLIEAQGTKENLQKLTEKLFKGNGFCKLENLEESPLYLIPNEKDFKMY
ncbi:MAG: acylphosphatase [Sarcina sp.]